jgi:CheY-like chemotaxis protein
MPSAPSILVVDDNSQVLGFFKRVLENYGYSVTALSSGTEALSVVQTGAFDLMILDLSMPEVDGFEVLKSVRSRVPDLKVLVVSGLMDGSLQSATELYGAACALGKPVRPKLLLEAVHRLL